MDALISVEHIEVSMLQSVEYWVMQSRPMARFLHKDRLGAMKQHIDWKGLWYMVHIFDFLLLLRTPAISEQIHGKTYSKTISGFLRDRTPYHVTHLRSTLKLSNDELGTQALHARISGVRKMSSVDTLAVGSVANTISVSANVKGS